MAAADLERLQEIRQTTLESLRILEERQALEGFATPPSVRIEIERKRRELGLVETVISSPFTAAAVDAVGISGQYMALAKQLDNAVKYLSERIDRTEESSLAWRKSERQARTAGQRRTRLVLFGIGLALLLLSAATIWTLATLKAHGL